MNIQNIKNVRGGINTMSTTTLKLIALFLMLTDHIAQFIPGIPIWFHWLGRLSASLFLFCMAWGFYYTRDRKKYLIRMYCFSASMAIINFIFNTVLLNYLGKTPYSYMSNNVFAELFCICVVISLIEYLRSDKKKGTKLILWFLGIQIVTTAICIYILNHDHLYGLEMLVGALTGNLVFNEGVLVAEIFGVLLYFSRDSKKRLILANIIGTIMFTTVNIIFCFIMIPDFKFNIEFWFMVNPQWMMIGALPLMLLYNGQKGRGLKYLFYLFYPIHIVILFLISIFCF